ncbi:MAG: hypothetical protein RMK57_02970 [Bryobacterales bacterium]|nr:hypothetical protein [Bryobacteraceae bacterium]MDW8353470.1 hypothetical protein [Bryobacterales bacterium]
MTSKPYLTIWAELWHSKILVSLALTLLVCSVLLWYRRRWPERWRSLVESFRRLSERRGICIVAVALAPVSMRLALVPWLPPCEPFIADEFGHLLVADTILHGRLANPPHPLRRHFETIHVLQEPAYASKYPLGQGLVLAAGRLLFGHPWAGVLLAVALMGGALTWALYAMLPAPWAVLGGLMGALHLGLKPWWSCSYWGGAFAAFAGALTFGALWRLTARPQARMALVAGLGWSLVWLVRAYESLLLAALLWGLLLWRILRRPAERRQWSRCLVAAGLPTLAVFGVTLLHNDRVTGSPWVLPYQHAQRRIGVPQSFVFQPSVPKPPKLTPAQESEYESGRRQHQWARENWVQHVIQILQLGVGFYGHLFFLAALVGFLWLPRHGVVRTHSVILLVMILLASLYVYFFPHYVAPYAPVMLLLLTLGLSQLPTGLWPRAGAGLVLASFAVVGGIIDPLVRNAPVRAFTEGLNYNANLRAEVQRRIAATGGRHVIVVRYTKDHDFHYEWVYNLAEVDASPVIWARYIDREALDELTTYYRGRCFWWAEVKGQEGVKLQRLPLPPEWAARASCPPGAFQRLELDWEAIRRLR